MGAPGSGMILRLAQDKNEVACREALRAPLVGGCIAIGDFSAVRQAASHHATPNCNGTYCELTFDSIFSFQVLY